MVKKRAIFYIGISILLMLFINCNTPPDPKFFKDGKQFGAVNGLFRERWWNFYERGVSFAEGGFWKEAAADFTEALRQRDRDQFRARTYGMHFIDYFPHRDLGIAYYHLGRYQDAKKELETSQSLVDTGKTKFYLNRVRKALLKDSNIDTAPPTIAVASVSEGAVTNRFTMTLEGEVVDDTYAHRIVINKEPLFIELSAKRIVFSEELKLKKGLNVINITTTDLLEKITEKKVKVFADFEGPLLNVKKYVDGQEVIESRVVLNGGLADAAGITTLKINNQIFAYNKEREIEFMFAVDLKEGSNMIFFTATDVAGNSTTGVLKLIHTPQLVQGRKPPGHPWKKQEPVQLALHGSGFLDTGQHCLFAIADPKQRGTHFRLNLKELTDTQTVFYDKIYIDGSVTGISDIKTITINGSPLLVIPGRTIFFNQLIQLQEGENKFTIDVQDAKGNRTSKTVTIIRKIPEVHQIGSRMSLAILPFKSKSNISSVASIMNDNLVSSFFNQNRFNIVSRGAELEAVLRELKLSETDLVDKDNAIKVGKLIAAEAILTGTVHETKNSIEIYGRLINTETSVLMEAKDVYAQDKSLSSIRYLTDGLALKFKHSFPLLEGMVIKVAGKSIYSDIGKMQHIKKDMKFIVFREGDPIVHPVTRKVLGCDSEELGVATVVNVFKDMSIGRLYAGFEPGEIKVKDLIITK